MLQWCRPLALAPEGHKHVVKHICSDSNAGVTGTMTGLDPVLVLAGACKIALGGAGGGQGVRGQTGSREGCLWGEGRTG